MKKVGRTSSVAMVAGAIATLYRLELQIDPRVDVVQGHKGPAAENVRKIE